MYWLAVADMLALTCFAWNAAGSPDRSSSYVAPITFFGRLCFRGMPDLRVTVKPERISFQMNGKFSIKQSAISNQSTALPKTKRSAMKTSAMASAKPGEQGKRVMGKGKG